MAQPAKIAATIDHIEDHAPGLRSLVLATSRRVPRFRPGQFLHLAIDSYDPSRHWPDSRVFSIASPPEDRRRLRITVSKVGRFTSRVMELQVGQQVWVKLPYGDFVVSPDRDRPVVFVAGGTGIAPFVSLLSSNEMLHCPVRVLYGVRTADLLIYASVMQHAEQVWPDLRWTPFVEDGPVPESGRRGRLDAKAAIEAAGTTDALFYLSGPPAMIETLRSGLATTGVAETDIRVDAWE